METNTVSFRTLTASIAAVLILETLYRWALPAGIAHSLFSLGLLRLVEIILLTLLVFRLEQNVAAIRLSPPRIVAGIKKGLLWSAAFGTAALMAWLGLLMAGINALQWVWPSLPSSPMQVVTFYVVGGVIAPVAEEIFFRGIIYGFLRRWGVATAVILSTLFFVCVHPLGRQIPIPQAIGGMTFALAYEREKNLVVPITIHSLGNLAIFSLSLVT